MCLISPLLLQMFKEIEELELLLKTTCEKIGKDENYLSLLANKYSDIGQGITLWDYYTVVINPEM